MGWTCHWGCYLLLQPSSITMLPRVVWQVAGPAAADSPTKDTSKHPHRPWHFAFFVNAINLDQNRHAESAEQTDNQSTRRQNRQIGRCRDVCSLQSKLMNQWQNWRQEQTNPIKDFLLPKLVGKECPECGLVQKHLNIA